MLLFLVLTLFVLVSCQEQTMAPAPISEPLTPLAPNNQEIPSPGEPIEEPVDELMEEQESLDDLLAQLEEDSEPAVQELPETSAETSSDQGDVVESTLPTSRKEACKQAQLPANYESCLAGCTKQCGDIARVQCDDVELPGADGQTFTCMTCSCT